MTLTSARPKEPLKCIFINLSSLVPPPSSLGPGFCSKYFNILKKLVIYLFWEKESGGRHRGRERERESLKQASCPAWSLTWGCISRTWDQNLSQTRFGCSTSWAPQAPRLLDYNAEVYQEPLTGLAREMFRPCVEFTHVPVRLKSSLRLFKKVLRNIFPL